MPRSGPGSVGATDASQSRYDGHSPLQARARFRHVALMIAQLTGETGLWALFASDFITSTLLPGGTEVLLLVLATQQHYEPWVLLSVASAGKSLCGLCSCGIGRMVACRFSARGRSGDKARLAIVPMQRWGRPLL